MVYGHKMCRMALWTTEHVLWTIKLSMDHRTCCSRGLTSLQYLHIRLYRIYTFDEKIIIEVMMISEAVYECIGNRVTEMSTNFDFWEIIEFEVWYGFCGPKRRCVIFRLFFCEDLLTWFYPQIWILLWFSLYFIMVFIVLKNNMFEFSIQFSWCFATWFLHRWF